MHSRATRTQQLAALAVVFVIATLMLSATGRASAGPAAELGDANCDGNVNSVDALLVLQLAAELIDALPCNANPDVNCDMRLDPTDALLILQYTAGLIDSLPMSGMKATATHGALFY